MKSGQITTNSALALLTTGGLKSIMRGYADGSISLPVLQKMRKRLSRSKTNDSIKFKDWFDARFLIRGARPRIGHTAIKSVRWRTDRDASPYATIPLHTLDDLGEAVAVEYNAKFIRITIEE